MSEPPVLEYNVTEPQENGYATLALVLGLSSILLPLSLLVGLPGIYCGIRGYLRARREQIPGVTRSVLGAALCALTLTVMVSHIVVEFKRSQASALRLHCQSDMRQIGASLMSYANDNKGWLPPSLDLVASYEYKSNPAPRCPLASTRKAYAGFTYVYQDAPVRPHRMKGASQLPVLYDDSAQRHDGLVGVLFMDGHVESLTPAELGAMLAPATTAPALLPE